MKFKKSLKNNLYSLNLSLKRFPISLIFSTATTFILIIIINYEEFFTDNTIDILGRIAMTLALAFPLFLAIKLFFEKYKNIAHIKKILIHLLAAFLIILYYFLLLKELNMVSVTRYIAFNLALYLLFLYLPYFYKRDDFELYVINIFSRLFVTIVYSGVLFAGLAMIIFTIEELFDLAIPEELYMTNFLLVAGIFAPIFLLAKLPSYKQEINITDYSLILKVLLLYIVMPIITVYTLILYVYFIKILVTMQWPQGLVAHLVLWYAVLSLIIIFFISPFKGKNKWVNTFIFWLPKLILPLLAMLFVAIAVRINTYGITENRYYVILLGLWSLGMMFYLNISKRKRNIIMPITLSIILVLAVSGPWSSYSLAKYSQNKRFADILMKYDMLQNERIVRAEKDIPIEDQTEINAIIRYFNNNHDLSELKYLPGGFSTEDTEKVFGFPYRYKLYKGNYREHFFYNFDRYYTVIDIEEYDYLFNINNNNKEIEKDNIIVKLENESNNNDLIIVSEGKEIYRKSLREKIIKIQEKYENDLKEEIEHGDFTFSDENESLKLKLVFKKISGHLDLKSNELYLKDIDFYLFIKISQ